MRILLTGASGQVGWELRRTLATLGDVIAPDPAQLDLADVDATRRAVRELRPSLIVNPAAYTAVDKAEQEKDLATSVNEMAPGVLAEEAKALGALLVHYSTDYVFDGSKKGAYTEDDVPNPLNTYGTTKLAGERAVVASGTAYLILRTSWVYGLRGSNFLRTMLRLAGEREELRIVDDQVGAPTWSRMIAEATAQILARLLELRASGEAGFRDASGIYHVTAGDSTTWYGFAHAIFREAEKRSSIRVPRVIPIATSDFPAPAARPRNSVLSNDRLLRTFGLRLPSWPSALAQCMEEMERS